MESFDYEVAKNLVKTTLGTHVEAIKSKETGHPTTIISDVNGTLTHPQIGTKIIAFLCDALDAGIPVRITTGLPDQYMPFRIVDKLHAAQPDGKWLLPKPFTPRENNLGLPWCHPGMLIDDESSYKRLAQGTYFDPKTETAHAFFTAWETLGSNDKIAALADWAYLHSQLEAKKNVAPVVIAQTPAPQG